jgi:hypothetical protein
LGFEKLLNKMAEAVNLLSETWRNFDSYEFRLLFDEHIGGPGQYDERAGNPNKLYLPLARESCRIELTFSNKKIIAIEPGPAYDSAEWNRISTEISESLAGSMKTGREYSFSSFRVQGSTFWVADSSAAGQSA